MGSHYIINNTSDMADLVGEVDSKTKVETRTGEESFFISLNFRTMINYMPNNSGNYY